MLPALISLTAWKHTLYNVHILDKLRKSIENQIGIKIKFAYHDHQYNHKYLFYRTSFQRTKYANDPLVCIPHSQIFCFLFDLDAKISEIKPEISKNILQF